MDKRKLKKLIMSYLVDKDEYKNFSSRDKKYVQEVFITIMDSVYLTIKHTNVIPVILTRDVDTQIILANALSSLFEYVPSVGKIRIVVVQ